MTSLSFVGVTADGSLSLRDAAGNTFELPVTQPVREAIAQPLRRSSRSSIEPPQVVIEGPVSPADVQRYIRQGADVEAIAAQAGMDPTTIQSFAVPVLQERSFIAQQAGKCIVPTGETLASAVASRLATRGITEGIDWDSWRRTDGTWTVVVRFPDEPGTFPLASESGAWLYDPRTRSVTAEDETARWLTNLATTPEPEPERVIVIEDVEVREEAPAEPRRRRRRGRRAPAANESDHVSGQLSLADGDIEEAVAPVPAPEAETSERPAEEHPSPQPVQPTGKPLSRRAARRQAARRRTEKHEPTWDEILFGVSRSEDPTR